MGFKMKSVAVFADENSVGLDRLPEGSIIEVRSYLGSMKMFYYIDNTGVTNTTTISDAITGVNIEDFIPELPADVLQDSAKSLTGDGYQTLSNGLIVQWGNINSGTQLAPNSDQNITFPIAFPTACLNVSICTSVNVKLTASNSMAILRNSLTTTGFGSYIPNGNNYFGYHWYAIGH